MIDIELLCSGKPPQSPEWLELLTEGRELLFEPFCKHLLDRYIPEGGSKFKFISGESGSGKTHFLRHIAAEAEKRNYFVINLSLRTVDFKLSNIVHFYQSIIETVDISELITKISQKIAADIGYDDLSFNETEKSLLEKMVEEEGLLRSNALKTIRSGIENFCRQADIGTSFQNFIFLVCGEKLGLFNSVPGCLSTDSLLSIRWLSGEKISARERRHIGIFEKLNKQSARTWLYSLFRMLRLSGKAGVLVALDDFEVLNERNPETGRYFYTPATAGDVFEFFRQIIDDAEHLPGLLFMVAGKNHGLDDEKRGVTSYEALWMRLQTGIVMPGVLNPYSDLLSMDVFMEQLRKNGGFNRICQRVRKLLRAYGYNTEDNPPELLENLSFREMITFVAAGLSKANEICA